MRYNVKEIIAYAIKIEEESYAFYTNAAQTVSNHEVIKLLTTLAKEEINHQNRLKTLIEEEKVSAEELNKKLDLDEILLEKIVGTPEILSDATPLEILQIALEREINSEQIYAMLSALTYINEDIIDVFNELRLQENCHVKNIQIRMKSL